MYGLMFNVLTIAALAIIGAVLAPKAGPARSKMWLGLILLIIGSVVGLLWQAALVLPAVHTTLWNSGGALGFGTVSSVVSVISTALFIWGVYVLCSAVVTGRQATSYLDPAAPGAPPTAGYQGTGYPTSGEKPSNPGTNPYA